MRWPKRALRCHTIGTWPKLDRFNSRTMTEFWPHGCVSRLLWASCWVFAVGFGMFRELFGVYWRIGRHFVMDLDSFACFSVTLAQWRKSWTAPDCRMCQRGCRREGLVKPQGWRGGIKGQHGPHAEPRSASACPSYGDRKGTNALHTGCPEMSLPVSRPVRVQQRARAVPMSTSASEKGHLVAPGRIWQNIGGAVPLLGKA